MENIKEEIAKLPTKVRNRLEVIMVDLLEYDKYWCARNGIDYLNPDIEKARQTVYNLYFKNIPSK